MSYWSEQVGTPSNRLKRKAELVVHRKNQYDAAVKAYDKYKATLKVKA